MNIHANSSFISSLNFKALWSSLVQVALLATHPSRPGLPRWFCPSKLVSMPVPGPSQDKKNNEKSIEKQQLSSVFSFAFEKGFFFLVLNFLALGRHSVAEARAARGQKASRNSITFMTESGLIQKIRNSINSMWFYLLSIVCAPFLF